MFLFINLYIIFNLNKLKMSFLVKNILKFSNKRYCSNLNLISYKDFENILRKSKKTDLIKIKSNLVKSLYDTDLELIKFYDECTIRYYRDQQVFKIVDDKKKIYTLLEHLSNSN